MNKLKSVSILASIGLSILLTVTGANAVPVLDQSFEPLPDSPDHWRGLQVGRQNVESAQTFTVGVTGQLVQLDLQLGIDLGLSANTGDILLDIRPTDEFGNPLAANDSSLLSLNIPGNGLSDVAGKYLFEAIDLGAGIFVNEGDILAIVLRSEFPNDSNYTQYAWGSTSIPGDSYQNGGSFYRCFLVDGSCGDEAWIGNYNSYLGDVDLGFRTYIDPVDSSVPAPGTLVLCCFGLIATALYSQTKIKKTVDG